MTDTHTIRIHDKGRVAVGTLEYDELEHEECRVIVAFEGERFVGLGTDYFDALTAVRKKLEMKGFLIDLYGANKNVWPSAMSRSMGGGLKAYRMTLGRQARSPDLVVIFDSGPDSVPCTVAEQEAFANAWFSSLR